MAWVLTRGQTTVRNEFNAVFPGRDKASDGSKGDPAHAASVSGHNPDRTGRAEYKDGDALDEVRAIDVDRDLVPGSGTDWMELVVQYLVRKARAGHYIPFRYIIYKGRIWSRTDEWRTRTYTGANKHDKHAHISGDYTEKADNWTGSLGLASLRQEEEPMALSAEDKDWIKETVRTAVTLGTYDWTWIGANGKDYRGISYASVVRPIVQNMATTVTGPPVAQVVRALAELDTVDEMALAQALAPAVAQVVIAGLPEDRDDVTVDELVEAFRRAVAGPIQ